MRYRSFLRRVYFIPLVGDGKEAFIEYFEKMSREYPDKSIEFVREVAEGELVVLHTHQIWPGNEEYVTMDFFRFDVSGKIVEHGTPCNKYLIVQQTTIQCISFGKPVVNY